MDDDKRRELLEAKASAEQQFEKMRTPVTILFSDIKGSTAYFERKGDAAGMSMFQRHNDLLFPSIQQNGGRVVKTIGDAIMACFEDPVGAVKAAVAMQRGLAEDRENHAQDEHIHVKVGMHMGLGLLKDNDVFGDVVNAAARVRDQAKPDQILITDVLLDAARMAGFQCANFGKAEMRGKQEVIDLYAVAWSDLASEQLIDEIQNRFESRLKDIRRQHKEVEEEYEKARDLWRSERRKLSAVIEELEDTLEEVRSVTRAQVSEDLLAEIRFELAGAVRARDEALRQLAAAQVAWDGDRNGLKAVISSMQESLIDAIEKSNNPARAALAFREQVDARIADAKLEWQLQWDGERRRLAAEIDRLKKRAGVDEKKDAARRVLREKLDKVTPGSATPAAKTGDQFQREVADSTIQWETERDQLRLNIQRLENELQRTQDAMRPDIVQELRAQYEPKLAQAVLERQLLDQDLQSLTKEFNDERARLTARLAALENAVPEAQASTRRQVSGELQEQFTKTLEEANRLISRSERKVQDLTEEMDAERRRAKRQIAQLEEQHKEAREAAFRAQRHKP